MAQREMVSYEIRVGGTIPPDLMENLSQVGAVLPAGTLVQVDVPDEAALWGLIDALRIAGVDLLEIRRRREEPPGEGDEPADRQEAGGTPAVGSD